MDADPPESAEELSVNRKRKKKSGTIMPPKKVPATEAETSSEIAIRPPADLPPISVNPQTASANLSAWYKVRDKLQVSTAYHLLQPLKPLRSLIDLPVQVGRNCQIHSLPSVTIQRKSISQNQAESKSVQIWSIRLQSPADLYEASPFFDLFPRYTKTGPLTFFDYGLLSSDIFTEEQVKEMGETACKILNRIPWSLEGELTYLTGVDLAPGYARSIVELLVLQSLGPSFPYNKLFVEALDMSGTPPKDFPKPITHYTVAYVDSDAHRPMLTPSDCTFQLQGKIDSNALPSLPKLPTSDWIAGTLPAASAEASTIRNQLLRYIRTVISLQLGSRPAVLARMQDLASPFYPTAKLRTLKLEDGADIFNVTTVKGKTHTKIDLTPAVQKLISGAKVPSIIVEVNSKVLVAYVMQQVFTNLLQHGLLRALQSGVLAADDVNTGAITRQKAKEQHCRCDDDETRSGSIHACMSCGLPRFCIELETTTNERRICVSCKIKFDADKNAQVGISRSSAEPEIVVPPVKPVKPIKPVKPAKQKPVSGRKADMQVVKLHISEVRARLAATAPAVHSPPIFKVPGTTPQATAANKSSGILLSYVVRETREMHEELDRTELNNTIAQLQSQFQAGGWHDAYSNKVRPYRRVPTSPDLLENAPFTKAGKGDPRKPSIEAVYPIVWVNGRPRVHHSSNVALTYYALNMVKGLQVPAFVPTVKKALEMSDRAPDAQDWTSFNTSSDHIHQIWRIIPTTRKARMLAFLPPDDVRAMEAMFRTGRFTGKFEGFNVPALATAAVRIWVIGGKDGEAPKFTIWKRQVDSSYFELHRWDDEKWAQMQAYVKKIESDTTINPNGYTIPRINDVPWLWRLDHAPKDLSKTFINLEMIARYATMKEWCDDQNMTQESPETVYYSQCIQFFASRHGLVDPILGIPLTVYKGHPQNYSIGRAPNVAPSSQMNTGFTTAHPTEWPEHYDPSRKTIAIYAWFINMMFLSFDIRLDAQGHPRLTDLLKAMIRDIATSTIYYEEPPNDLAKIPYPEHWRRMAYLGGARGRYLTDAGFDLTGVGFPAGEEEPPGEKEPVAGDEEPDTDEETAGTELPDLELLEEADDEPDDTGVDIFNNDDDDGLGGPQELDDLVNPPVRPPLTTVPVRSRLGRVVARDLQQDREYFLHLTKNLSSEERERYLTRVEAASDKIRQGEHELDEITKDIQKLSVGSLLSPAEEA